MRAIVLLVVWATSMTACMPSIYRAPVRQPNYFSINPDGSRSQKYSRVNQWTSYGVGGLGAQSKISAAYEEAQHAPAPELTVAVYNAALPAGITLEHGAVKIAKDAPYEAVGRFEIGYWMDSAPRESEIEEDLRRLAAVANANTIVVEIQRVAHGNDRVRYVNGIVLRKFTRPTAPVAHGRRSRANAKLVYKAIAGCLTADQFADEVSARLGYSPWRPDAESTLRAEIRRDQSAFHAVISMTGAQQPKQLSAPTCKTLVDAMVAAVVVRLDDPI